MLEDTMYNIAGDNSVVPEMIFDFIYDENY